MKRFSPLYILPFAWLILCFFFYWLDRRQQEQYAHRFSEMKMETLGHVYLNIRAWASDMSGILVPEGKVIPNPWLPPSSQGIVVDEKMQFVRVNPAYLIRLLNERQESKKVCVSMASLSPLRPQNKADAWEAEQLEAFLRNPHKNPSIEITPIGKQTSEQRYLFPLFAEKSCLNCHTQNQEGDLLGGLSLRFRNENLEESFVATTSALTYAIFGIVVATIFGIGIWRHQRNIAILCFNEQRSRLMSRLVDAVLFDYDLTLGTAQYSALWEKVFGYTLENRTKIPYDSLIDATHHDDKLMLAAVLHQLHRGERHNTALEVRLSRYNKTYLWCCIEATVLIEEHSNKKHIVGSIRNIDDEKKEKIALQHRALYDSLTSVMNRGAFQTAVEIECGKACINEESCPGKTGNPANPDLCPHTTAVPCVFILVDVDFFKTINDTKGHLYGDAILQAVTRTLEMVFPSPALVGRLGGDEFAVFLPYFSGLEPLHQQLKALSEALSQCRIENETVAISCSLGATIEHQGECRYSIYYQHADIALYRAKKNGRGRYCIYEEDLEKLGLHELVETSAD